MIFPIIRSQRCVEMDESVNIENLLYLLSWCNLKIMTPQDCSQYQRYVQY